MVKNKKIFVLISAYNVGRLIQNTFDSLIKQTYPYWECYCMNDGSTDNTYDVMQKYAASDKRIHVFTQDNAGLTHTNNRLLNMLKDDETDYIYFLDSDDYLHPQTFEMAVKIQENTQVDVVECTPIRVGDEKPDSYFEKFDVSKLPVQILTDMDAFLLKRTRRDLPGTWINKCKLYVWEKIKSVRFDENLSYEDDYFYNSIVHTLIDKKAVILQPFYYWRINPDSMTRSVDWQRYQKACTARIYASYDYFIRQKHLPENLTMEFKADLTADAFRMVGRKPVRKCKEPVLRRQLFEQACRIFSDMRTEDVIDTSLVGFSQRLIFWSFRCHLYHLTRFLLLFK